MDIDPGYVKAYHRRSVAHEMMEIWHDALQDLNQVLFLEPDVLPKEHERLAEFAKRAHEDYVVVSLDHIFDCACHWANGRGVELTRSCGRVDHPDWKERQ